MLLTHFCTCLSSLNIYPPLKLTILLGQRRASLIPQLVENLPAVWETPVRFLGWSPGEGIDYPLQYSWASLVAQLVKTPPEMRETWVWSLGWKDAWRRERLPTPVFCLENSMDYRPWGHKESDMTEWFSHFTWTEEPGRLQSMGSEIVRYD